MPLSQEEAAVVIRETVTQQERLWDALEGLATVDGRRHVRIPRGELRALLGVTGEAPDSPMLADLRRVEDALAALDVALTRLGVARNDPLGLTIQVQELESSVALATRGHIEAAVWGTRPLVETLVAQNASVVLHRRLRDLPWPGRDPPGEPPRGLRAAAPRTRHPAGGGARA